jgi:DNA primase catalytic subunit
MKLYLFLKKKSSLPEIEELAFTIWDKNINFSKIGDHYVLKNCTVLSLSWDKWYDDPRWKGNEKSREYIDFELITEKYKRSVNVSIHVADDAVFVDKRAVHKAAVFLAQTCDGKISEDGKVWGTPEEYSQIVKEYLQCTFVEAVEKSLTINNQS